VALFCPKKEKEEEAQLIKSKGYFFLLANNRSKQLLKFTHTTTATTMAIVTLTATATATATATGSISKQQQQQECQQQ
jgi:hypothetical protein